MIRDFVRWSLVPVALVLGVLALTAARLDAQQPGVDTSAAAPAATPAPAPPAAPAAQGYAPSNAQQPRTFGAAELAKYPPATIAGVIALPPRSAAAVDEAGRAAERALARADSGLAAATERQARTESLVQSRQRRLAEIEAQRKQADKEKRKGDKAALEAEKKTLTRRLGFAKDLQGLDDAEISVARKAREAAIANQQAVDLERKLVEKRGERPGADWRDTGPGDGESAVIRELERQTLVAQKKAADLDKELAGKRSFVLGKRLDLYKAYLSSEKKGS
jgi:hypothetical protein